MSPQGKEVRDFSKPDVNDFVYEGVFVTPSGGHEGGGEGNRRMSTTTLPMDADAKSTTEYPAFRDNIDHTFGGSITMFKYRVHTDTYTMIM